MKLQFKKYGQTGPVVVILHGFLGMLDNWHPVAKALSSDCTVFSLDQRNHGRSPHSSVFTLASMVDDLIEFLDDQRLESVSLLGHSMGGKIAMFTATSYPARVDKLFVVDIGVRSYGDITPNFLEALRQFPVEKVTSRKEADAILAKIIPDSAIRQLLLKNLTRRHKGGMAWRINLPVLIENYRNILIPLPPEARFEGPALFIRGGKSPYIQPEDVPEIRRHFPKALFKTIVNAGHWVHAEATSEFVQTVQSFLLSP